LHEYVRTSPLVPLVALTVPCAGAESAGEQGCATQVGAALQVPFTRHFAVAAPESTYPALHAYVTVSPVMPVPGIGVLTVPWVGAEGGDAQEFAVQVGASLHEPLARHEAFAEPVSV
jgi:hypothetical protein